MLAGALHLWAADGAASATCQRWLPRHAGGGHWRPVVDGAWGVDGRCLVTVGQDQTARIFTDVNGHWCELARSQVGIAFNCVFELVFAMQTPQ